MVRNNSQKIPLNSLMQNLNYTNSVSCQGVLTAVLAVLFHIHFFIILCSYALEIQPQTARTTCHFIHTQSVIRTTYAFLILWKSSSDFPETAKSCSVFCHYTCFGQATKVETKNKQGNTRLSNKNRVQNRYLYHMGKQSAHINDFI